MDRPLITLGTDMPLLDEHAAINVGWWLWQLEQAINEVAEKASLQRALDILATHGYTEVNWIDRPSGRARWQA